MDNNFSKNKWGLVIHLDLSRDRDDMFGCYDSVLYNIEGGNPVAQAGRKKMSFKYELKNGMGKCVEDHKHPKKVALN